MPGSALCWPYLTHSKFDFDAIHRPAYPKILVSTTNGFFLQIHHHQWVKTEQCKRSFFSIIHLVRTVWELTSSIIQTHHTLWLGPLYFVYICESRSPSKTADHFRQKTMHHVCCFRWCRDVLSWTAVVWSELVSLVLCTSSSSSVSCSHFSPTASNSNQLYRKTAIFRKVSMQCWCSLV